MYTVKHFDTGNFPSLKFGPQLEGVQYFKRSMFAVGRN